MPAKIKYTTAYCVMYCTYTVRPKKNYLKMVYYLVGDNFKINNAKFIVNY